MRLLRATHTVNPALGGPIESIRQSSAALVRRGHDVEIISLDAPNDPWVRDSAIPVHALGPGLGSYGYAPRFSDWIRAQRANYDAVIVHGVWQYSSFGVWRALAGADTPYFVFPHGMLDPWFNRAYPLKHLKKLLYWTWAEYRVLRDAAAVLFTSEEEKRLARESFRPYRCNEVAVNYGTAAPSVDFETARNEFFDRWPELREKRLLLFLGRLHEKKGCDLLLRAFAASEAARSHHLLLAGPAANDGYLQQLQRLTKSLASGGGQEVAVTFTGMLMGNLKWGAFAAAEAFVLPSHQENFGIAVVEALACGTPVLISNKVNIWREVIADGGGFAEEDDLEGTRRLLARWLETSAQTRAQMGGNARASFRRRFEINRAVDSLLEVLQNHQCRG